MWLVDGRWLLAAELLGCWNEREGNTRHAGGLLSGYTADSRLTGRADGWMDGVGERSVLQRK